MASKIVLSGIPCVLVLACGAAGNPGGDGSTDVGEETGEPDGPPPPCGDGVIDSGEECDDGNDADWDGCTLCRVSEFRVNEYAWDRQFNPTVSVSQDGRFAIAWESELQDRDGWGVFGRLMEGSSGTPAGHEFQLNDRWRNDEKYPSIAVDSGGGIVAAWSSNGQDGDNYGVFGRRFDSAGASVGSEFQVNGFSTDEQWIPDVAVAGDGRFVVVWTSEEQDGSGDGVFGRLYGSDGSPLGPEFQINTYTTDDQTGPSVVMADDGRFVVVWVSEGQDGSLWGVYGQRFDGGAVPEGPEFRVNAVTEWSEWGVLAGMLLGGGFAVLWLSRDSTETVVHTVLQRFDPEGIPSADPITLDPYLPGDYGRISVAVAPDGRFILAWEMQWSTGDERWIFSRRFDPSGLPLGAELTANSRSDGHADYVSAAISSDGRSIIAWDYLDLDDLGIYAQRFDADGNPRGLLPW